MTEFVCVRAENLPDCIGVEETPAVCMGVADILSVCMGMAETPLDHKSVGTGGSKSDKLAPNF